MKCTWLAMCVLLASGVSAPMAAEPATRAEFVVFDGLLHSDKPNLRRLGMIELRGSGNLWRPGTSRDAVDERGVRSAARWLATLGPNYYLDIEHWPVVHVPEATIEASIAKLIRVSDIARATTPDRNFGFYGLLPHAAYWAIVLRDEKAIAAWRRSNEISRPLASRVDFVLPSLYTFYEDREGWVRAAREVLTAARQYGKPVYPFLWPEYHDSTKLAGQPLPRDYWRMQLELCRQYADGVVIWGGYRQRWDDKAPWWLETQEFLKTVVTEMSPASASLQSPHRTAR
jgi:hypothetical protein